ncbi:protocatechuate 3,4-dioxygenase subunit alpha [Kibdelosporangium phytohabitans]|uniref:Protocatechuate 3,4-dioxygenase n=1 Tax=Kibdelosporangium phytohabitans TaxID=860235 RepID=A0A0N9ICE8_9PSEU|nr:protocatechuate 3,4-dioxygenase subunit alpha [Kibdelosporangium phytohabitans]ALG12621.1 protocatechuate 3,4-dioxygenase [Kibdelosporangium phytohabitans]MBE1464264.1 protocatechuate 3,4-dioxygenase alpha subunit [Kibdelosporangium phytohabitans]
MTTPSQTVGPFLSIGLPWPDGPTVVPEGTAGAIRIVGTVYDGAGQPVPDALIETWQADPDGHFDHPDDPSGPLRKDFRAFGRCPTESDGTYWILTLPPGAIPGQAPHIDVSVFARGLLNRVVTRIYLADDPADPVLSSVDPARRHTLIAQPTDHGYRFDIRLQGENETVFFDV